MKRAQYRRSQSRTRLRAEEADPKALDPSGGARERGDAPRMIERR
jgi:hypothetical protein